MQVSIVGSGYVGTTVAACLTELGHEVTAVDVDEEVVAAINDGRAPINEPDLDGLLAEHAGHSLRATTEYAAVRDTELTLLALPTPSNPDGSIDTSIIEAGARSLGEALQSKAASHTVAVKSTVIPGTTEDVLTQLLLEPSASSTGESIAVAANPEFQREGSAVRDFFEPDKIVVGTNHDRAARQLETLYQPLIDRHSAPIVHTGPREAEMIKYANNAFLASKVSLINDLGNVCKELGVDTYAVADAIGLDDRIGAKFLRSGLGWGGSCFPKDTKALIASAQEQGYDPAMLEAAVTVNDRQPQRMLKLMDRHVEVADQRVAVLGLAFKPGTDDIRNARAVPVITGLLKRGADVIAYDPVAADKMHKQFPEIEYASSSASALEDAVAALVVTEWEEIADLDAEFDAMATPVVIDGRDAIARRDGLVYEGLTW